MSYCVFFLFALFVFLLARLINQIVMCSVFFESILSFLIMCTTKFPLFFDENATLLWKNGYKWIIKSIAHRSLTLFPIILAELEYRYDKSVHLLRLPKNPAIFRCLHMSGTIDKPDHVPSTGTSNNRTAQYVGNAAGGVRLSIWAFPGRF